VCLAAALLLWLRGPLQDRRYAQALEREIHRLEAVEREVRGLERQTEHAGARRRQLESLRRRPEADLALITEVSRRLPSAVWLNAIEVTDNSAQLSGQADSAAPLLGLLDNSGVLTESAFAASLTRSENREIFRIRATRKDRLPPPSAAAPGPPAISVQGAPPVAPPPAAAPVPPGHNAH
jgi:Tfp pilus assembly protein PilN